MSGLCAYGQPRVGNRALAQAFDRDFKPRAFRFVNNNDAIPRVPPPGLLLRYNHAGTLLYFDGQGDLRSDFPWWRRAMAQDGRGRNPVWRSRIQAMPDWDAPNSTDMTARS